MVSPFDYKQTFCFSDDDDAASFRLRYWAPMFLRFRFLAACLLQV